MKFVILTARFARILLSVAFSVAFFLFLFLAKCSRPLASEEEPKGSKASNSNEQVPDAAGFYYNDWLQKLLR